jgi:hypothetical protein
MTKMELLAIDHIPTITITSLTLFLILCFYYRKSLLSTLFPPPTDIDWQISKFNELTLKNKITRGMGLTKLLKTNIK